MKVSIITVTYNSEKYLTSCINSVLNQTYKDIEYIIIDGSSSDNTINIINNFGEKINKFITEPDVGLYDAINKGIKTSTGEIIGLLHSDDYFYNNFIIEMIVNSFNNNIDCVYANSFFINSVNGNKTRFYFSGNFNKKTIKYGLMPSHPTMYFKREVLIKYPLYNLNYKIAADFDLVLRHLLLYNTKMFFVNKIWVIMREGGISTNGFKSKIDISKQILKICKANGLKTNYFFINFRLLYKLLYTFK